MKKTWNKKRICIFSITILILIGILIYFCFFQQNKTALPYQLETLEEILEYYECTLIKKENSKQENIQTDIYIKLPEDYYTGEQSNKTYFTSLIRYVSENLSYCNYNLIDNDREIYITVFGNQDSSQITSIYYNGDRNYFDKRENQKNIEQYEEIPITDFEINSVELRNAINEKWRSGKVNFGTRRKFV